MTLLYRGLRAVLAATALFAAGALHADEATIRKNVAERLPQIQKIDEVSKTPMPGLFEVRVGTDIFYTDAEANFLIQGQLMDVRQHRNLTEARLDKLMAISFGVSPPIGQTAAWRAY